MSSIWSVALRMDSTTGSPMVRFGTKWLSITSTWTASASGILAISPARFAKSAFRMLGVMRMGEDYRTGSVHRSLCA